MFLSCPLPEPFPKILLSPKIKNNYHAGLIYLHALTYACLLNAYDYYSNHSSEQITQNLCYLLVEATDTNNKYVIHTV